MMRLKEAWSRVTEPAAELLGTLRFIATPSSLDAERRRAQQQENRPDNPPE
jgi:hypothetical protein